MGRKCLFHFDMERISTFSAIEKALAGRKKSFRGSYVVQACTDVTLLVFTYLSPQQSRWTAGQNYNS